MFGSDDDAYVSRWAECFECGARGPNSIHEGETTPEQESALEAEAQAAWNRRSAASLGEQHDR
jgi:transposase-like protein